MKKPLSNQFFILATLVTGLCFTSCEDDGDDPPDSIAPLPSTGVYIVNEGAFNQGNSSISFLNFEDSTLTNNIYESVNGVPLGDLAQSMTIHQGKGYILVNNSQKIEVVNIADFTSVQTITGLSGPRHMMPSGTKAYVCDWFSNEVAVLDLTSGSIIKHIPTGNGPEQSAISGTKLFVANVGGFGMDSTVTVIDMFGDTVLTTLQVGINPNSIVSDKYGKIWVLCGGSTGPDFIGGTGDDIAGSLWCINPNSYVIEEQYVMNPSDHPLKLQVYATRTMLAYLFGTDGYSGQVVKMSITANGPNNTPIINKTFYGLAIDETNQYIYGGYSAGFTQNGTMFRYTQSGILLDSMEVGIAPNGFVFTD